MGAFVGPLHAFRMIGHINGRFAEGDPIAEMAVLQQEFSIFSEAHDLKASANLLGLAPDGSEERKDWFLFLDSLKELDSSEPPLSGHDLIRATLQAELAGNARPVFFQYHDGQTKPRVLVTVSAPLVFSSTQYVVVSVPTWTTRAATRLAARKRMAAREAAGAKDAKPAKAGRSAAAGKTGKTGKARKAPR